MSLRYRAMQPVTGVNKRIAYLAEMRSTTASEVWRNGGLIPLLIACGETTKLFLFTLPSLSNREINLFFSFY